MKNETPNVSRALSENKMFKLIILLASAGMLSACAGTLLHCEVNGEVFYIDEKYVPDTQKWHCTYDYQGENRWLDTEKN